jgi:hypothetical protein
MVNSGIFIHQGHTSFFVFVITGMGNSSYFFMSATRFVCRYFINNPL